MKSPLHRCLRAALGLGLASAALLAPATAQGRPDTVYRLNERTGKVLAITGTVLENSLTKVRIDRSGKESSYDASEVVQIDWGSVPPAYRDGMTYRRKGEFAEAVDAFRVAATDASTREVVQADARLKAAETLLQLGASDAGQYQEAAAEAEKLVSDFGESSLVPRARYVIGRALRLSGQDAAAAEALEALYGEGSTDPATPGYSRRAYAAQERMGTTLGQEFAERADRPTPCRAQRGALYADGSQRPRAAKSLETASHRCRRPVAVELEEVGLRTLGARTRGVRSHEKHRQLHAPSIAQRPSSCKRTHTSISHASLRGK